MTLCSFLDSYQVSAESATSVFRAEDWNPNSANNNAFSTFALLPEVGRSAVRSDHKLKQQGQLSIPYELLPLQGLWKRWRRLLCS